MAQIFQMLRIMPLTTGGTYIQWQLHSLFPAPAPYTFTCQVSRTGASDGTDWVNLPNVLVGDARNIPYSNVDRSQRIFALADRVFYRVKLVANDGQTFYSPPQAPYADLPRPHRQELQFILRDQMLWMQQGPGTCGLLFKRKYWGTRCTNPGCRDKDTHEVSGRRCTICLDTGWVGGYAVPIPFWIAFTDNKPEKIGTGPVGQGFIDVATARVVLCPELQTADIFYDPSTDARWWVDNVDVTAQIKSYPVLADITIKQVEPSSVLYLLDGDHAG